MIAAERWGATEATVGVWFLHGILGQGRNWRSFARRLAEEVPAAYALLPDLRCHGASAGLPPPHTLAACADDLDRLEARHGAPRVVVAHSFGGKVALERLRRRPVPDGSVTVVLDSPPGPGHRGDGPGDPARVLPALRAAPVPAPDRAALRAPLDAAGVPPAVVAWLASSARQDADGWRWGWDLDGVEALLRDYLATDLWPFLGATAHRVVLVEAGRSDRYTDADRRAPTGPGVTRARLPDAGHWVHVDDPAGTAALVRAAVDEALGGPAPAVSPAGLRG